jgi:hypothetical protein
VNFDRSVKCDVLICNYIIFSIVDNFVIVFSVNLFIEWIGLFNFNFNFNFNFFDDHL